eukprot:gene34757-40824_t
MPMDAAAPIGIFDSGIGGLSVLRHVRSALPGEQLIYFADSGYAPYGDKSEAQIIERSLTIAAFLVGQGVKALVVACNTATAAAIEAIRRHWPALIVVGMEPGLKPAAQHSKSGVVGVLATRSTLASARFVALREQLMASGSTRFLSKACVGLVDQIEKGELHSLVTAALIDRYVTPLIEQGADTLVLGCTHYPFVRTLIEVSARQAGCAAPLIIDTGEAVTRQLKRLLQSRDVLAQDGTTGLIAYTTASSSTLSAALSNLLKLPAEIREIRSATAADAIADLS